MTVVSPLDRLVPGNWRRPPVSWDILRRFPIGWIGAILFGVGTFGLFFLALWLIRAPFLVAEPPEFRIAVVFPASSEDNWRNFVEGVRLANVSTNAKLEIVGDGAELKVTTPGVATATRYFWVNEVGVRSLRRRVHELATGPKPPIALIGANNTCLTAAITEELAPLGNRAPVLLMTVASGDELTQKLPDRSFRFGGCNRNQAATVVKSLTAWLEQRSVQPVDVRVLAIQAKDDPFSVDLARDFADEMERQLAAPLLKPESGGPAWSLPTATGSFEAPNQEELAIARRLVRQMLAEPQTTWVFVAPVGMSQYRRLLRAIDQILDETVIAMEKEMLRRRLVFVMGDTLRYHPFVDPSLGGVPTDLAPAATIFFAHVAPLDSTVSATPHRHVPDRSLSRLVASALQQALAGVGPRATPADLARGFRQLTDAAGEPVFDSTGERPSAGGAIVAQPNPHTDRFDIQLPIAWQ